MIGKLIEKVVEILERHVIIRFVISGGTSAFIDLVILFLLNSVLGIHYLLSAILAFVGAFGVSFTLHKFWTFKSHDESAHKQVALYLGVSLFGLLLNTFLMYVFVDHIFSRLPLDMRVNVILSQIVVGLIVACFSFFLSHRFVFKYKKEKGIEIDITR